MEENKQKENIEILTPSEYGAQGEGVNKSNRITPQKKVEAIAMLAGGNGTRRTARVLGLTQKQVERVKHQNRELIEAQAQKYIDMLPNMVQHDVEEIKKYYITSKQLGETLSAVVVCGEQKNILGKEELANLKAIQEYCAYMDKRVESIKKSVGLYSSEQGMVFQQLNVFSNRSVELSPIINQLLEQAENKPEGDGEGDIIDVEKIERERENNS